MTVRSEHPDELFRKQEPETRSKRSGDRGAGPARAERSEGRSRNRRRGRSAAETEARVPHGAERSRGQKQEPETRSKRSGDRERRSRMGPSEARAHAGIRNSAKSGAALSLLGRTQLALECGPCFVRSKIRSALEGGTAMSARFALILAASRRGRRLFPRRLRAQGPAASPASSSTASMSSDTEADGAGKVAFEEGRDPSTSSTTTPPRRRAFSERSTRRAAPTPPISWRAP